MPGWRAGWPGIRRPGYSSRPAAIVLVPVGHPARPALDEAGIGYQLAGGTSARPGWSAGVAAGSLADPGATGWPPAGLGAGPNPGGRCGAPQQGGSGEGIGGLFRLAEGP